MTPAMLFALEQAQKEQLELWALPIDKFHWTYVNAHRDPGEIDGKGTVVRPPADPVPFDVVRTFASRRPSLAAKEAKEEWNYSLLGARADRDQFEAWAGQQVKAVFVKGD